MSTISAVGKDDREIYERSIIVTGSSEIEWKSIVKYSCDKVRANFDMLFAANNLIEFKTRFNNSEAKLIRPKPTTLASLYTDDYSISELRKLVTKNMMIVMSKIAQAHINAQLDEYFTDEKSSLIKSNDEPYLKDLCQQFSLKPLLQNENVNIYDCEIFTLYAFESQKNVQLTLIPRNGSLPISYIFTTSKLSEYLNFILLQELKRRASSRSKFIEFSTAKYSRSEFATISYSTKK